MLRASVKAALTERYDGAGSYRRGAGYIGSTIASVCSDSGINSVILDSLVSGRREMAAGREFYEGDIADGQLIDRIFAEHPDIGAVIHCLDFVGHLLRNGCRRLIFSSSAAIYQVSEDLTMDEDSPVDPQSPYGRTKAMCEAMFADIAAAEPIRVLSLRYFNPIGADPKMRTGLQLARPTHALGKMIQAHEEGVPFVVTGTDYPTRDGSGIRDYIHVWDLAAAHVAALDRFDACRGRRPLSTWGLAEAPPSGNFSTPLITSPRARSRRSTPTADRETSLAPTRASTARGAFLAGSPSTTSPKASVTRFSGPRSATRSCLATHLTKPPNQVVRAAIGSSRSWNRYRSSSQPPNPAWPHTLESGCSFPFWS